MGRYRGPKARVNRALGTIIYEESGAIRALKRRNRPPGVHLRRRRTSAYGAALKEKKKIKHHYGLDERQLRRFFDLARRQPGNTGQALLALCERRLDSVVRRAGFTATRPQARQSVVHGHIRVNGRKLDRPSYLVRVGDVIEIRKTPRLWALYLPTFREAESLSWLRLDPERLRAEVTALPAAGDVSLPVEVSPVVELLSR